MGAIRLLSLLALLACWTVPASATIDLDPDAGLRIEAPADAGGDRVAISCHAWGDLDNDGDLDLVIGHRIPSTVSAPSNELRELSRVHVLWNANGSFSYANSTPLAFTTRTTTAIALGDVNSDGLLDVYVSRQGDDDRIYLNQGGQSFLPTPSWSNVRPAPNSPVRAALFADLDGNGAMDLALVEGNSQPVRVHFDWQGNGFAEVKETSATFNGNDLVTWNPNGDNRLDLLVACQAQGGNGGLAPIINDGSWRSGPFISASAPFRTATTSVRGLAVSALDDSGSYGAGVILTTTGDIAEIWSVDANLVGNQIWTSPGPYNVAVADMDGDGATEIAFNQRLSSSLVYSFADFALSGPTGSFSQNLLQSAAATHAGRSEEISFADIDSDGQLEVVLESLGFLDNDPSFITVFRNESLGLPLTGTQLSPARKTRDLALGPLTSDPFVDVLEGGISAPDIVRSGSGSGLPVNGVDLAGDANTTAVAMGDINNDGFADLVAAKTLATTRVFRSQGGSFGLASSSLVDTTKIRVSAVDLGDVDGDGDLDLLIAEEDGPVRVWLSNVLPGGGISYAANAEWVSQETALPATAATFADVDGDGDLDVVVATAGQGDVIYNNLGSTARNEIALTLSADWVGGSTEATSHDFGDINGDGRLDMVVGIRGGGNAVYLADGNASPLTVSSVYPSVPSWTSADADATVDVDLVDVDGDGDLDLFAANELASNALYLNDNGALATVAVWRPTAYRGLNSRLRGGDFDGDGDEDVLLAIDGGLNFQFENTRNDYGDSALSVNNPPALRIEAALPRLYASDVQIVYTLADAEADPAAVSFQFSPNGGGAWQACLPVTAPPASRASSAGGRRYSFYWDIDRQLVSGQQGLNDVLARVRGLAHELPRNGGPIQHAAARAITHDVRCQATPTGAIIRPEAQGTDNQAIELVFVSTEDLGPVAGGTVEVIFTGQGCDTNSPHTVLVHDFNGSPVPLESVQAPALNAFTLDGDDLNKDGSNTLTDLLAEGCAYTVELRLTDAAGNTFSTSIADWVYSTSFPVLTDFTLRDASLARNQDPADRALFTNNPELEAVLSWDNCANGALIEQQDALGDCNLTLLDQDLGGSGCDRADVPLPVTIATSGDTMLEQVTLCATMTTLAGNSSQTLGSAITIDEVYDGNVPVTLINGRVGTFVQNSSTVTIEWSGMEDKGSGYYGAYCRSDAWAANWAGAPAGIGDPVGVWLDGNRSFTASGVPAGTYDFEVRFQDRAGNVSDWYEYEGCIDLVAPAWGAGDALSINGSPAQGRLSNEPELELDWPGIADSGCSDFDFYVVSVNIDGQPVAGNPFQVTAPPFTYPLPVLEGAVEILVAGVDKAGNVSAPLGNAITIDRVAPKVYMAGYLPVEGFPTALYSHELGEFTLFAFAPDSDVTRVELMVPDNANGQIFRRNGLNGTQLVDTSAQTISLGTQCGFGANDGFYMLCAPLDDYLSPFCATFGIRAYDAAGNGSALWPFLNVHRATAGGACPTSAPPGPEAILDHAALQLPDVQIETKVLNLLDPASSLGPETPSAEEARLVKRAKEPLVEHLMHLPQPFGQVGPPQTTGVKGGPRILGGGYWDSEIVCETDSALTMVMIVVDQDFPDTSLDGFLYTGTSSTNCNGQADLASAIFSPNPDPSEQNFHYLVGPDAPLLIPGNTIGLGAYRAVDYIQSPVSPYPLTGGYLFGTVFRNPNGVYSNVWPHLTINCIPLAVENLSVGPRNVIPGDPYTVEFDVTGGVPRKGMANGSTVPCYNVTILWGDGAATDTLSCRQNVYNYRYPDPGKYKGRVLVSDTGLGRNFGCSADVERVFDVNVSSCFQDPGSIFVNLDITIQDTPGEPFCQAQASLLIECQPFASINWTLDGQNVVNFANSTTATFNLERGRFYTIAAEVANANPERPGQTVVVTEEFVTCGAVPLTVTDCGISPRTLQCGESAMQLRLEPSIVGGIPDSQGQYVLEWVITRTQGANVGEVVFSSGPVQDNLTVPNVGRSTWGPGTYTAELRVTDFSQPTPTTIIACAGPETEIYISPLKCECLVGCDLQVPTGGSSAFCSGAFGRLTLDLEVDPANPCVSNISLRIREQGFLDYCDEFTFPIDPNNPDLTYDLCSDLQTLCGFGQSTNYELEIYLDDTLCQVREFTF